MMQIHTHIYILYAARIIKEKQDINLGSGEDRRG